MEFAPNTGIKGGHMGVKNDEYWKVGCLGITPTCTQKCEQSFLNCVDEQNPQPGKKQARAFATCMKEDTFTNLPGCTVDCAPSFNMLSASEMPTKHAFETFGAPIEGLVSERPTESLCMVEN